MAGKTETIITSYANRATDWPFAARWAFLADYCNFCLKKRLPIWYTWWMLLYFVWKIHVMLMSDYGKLATKQKYLFVCFTFTIKELFMSLLELKSTSVFGWYIKCCGKLSTFLKIILLNINSFAIIFSFGKILMSNF